MITNIDNQSSSTVATGEYAPEPFVRRIINLGRYEIEIRLTRSGEFIDILSIKAQKNFAESVRSTMNPTIHDVEKYYRED